MQSKGYKYMYHLLYQQRLGKLCFSICITASASILASEQIPATPPTSFVPNYGQIQNSSIQYYCQYKEYWVSFSSNAISFHFLEPVIKDSASLHEKHKRCEKELSQEISMESFSLFLHEPWNIHPAGPHSICEHHYKNGQHIHIREIYDTLYYYHPKEPILMKFYTYENRLKYDIVIYDHTKKKELCFSTNATLSASNHSIIFSRNGKTYVEEKIPLIVSLKNPTIPPSVTYKIQNNTIIYRWSSQSIPLLIDPIEYSLKYGTYYGGNNIDYTYCILHDYQKNIYIVGYTLSPNNIATPGAYKTFQQDYDIYVAKFDSNGVRLWATYFGGEALDRAYTACIDSTQHIIIAGNTGSNTGIATTGAYQTSLQSIDDAFLVRFAPNGTLKWATYYGGNGHDFIEDITTYQDKIIFSGHTRSTNNIASIGAHQSTFNGIEMCHLGIFDTTGNKLYGSYFGNGNYDNGTAIEVNNVGKIFIAGHTASNSNIATVGSYQPTKAGNYDCFISRWSINGSLEWATYFGGSNADFLYNMDIDNDNAIFITGYTESPNNIATAGTYQTSILSLVDGFLAKFSQSTGYRLWGTYVGGLQVEYINDVAFYQGYLYLFGFTSTLTLATSGAFQPNKANGFDNIFLIFDTTGNRVFGTYYGGSGAEYGQSIKVMDSRNILVAGYADNTTNLVTSNGHQPNFGGSFYDGFWGIICKPMALPFLNYSGSVNTCYYDTIILVSLNTFASYLWNTGNSSSSLSVAQNGYYYLEVVDSLGCYSKSDTVFINIIPQSIVPINASSLIMCAGDSVILQLPPGYLAYTWLHGDSTQTTWVSDSGSYTATLIDNNNCLQPSDTVWIAIAASFYPIILTGDSVVCFGDSVIMYANPSLLSVQWNTGHTAFSYSPDSSGYYSYSGIDSLGCQIFSDTLKITFISSPDPLPTFNNQDSIILCPGQTYLLVADSGYVQYIWSNGTNGQTLLVSLSGNYYVTVQDTNGCWGTSDTLTVIKSSFDSVPVLTDLLPPYCPYMPVSLCAAPGLDSVVWNTGDTLPCINASAGTPAVYFYSAIDSLHCLLQSDTFLTQFYPSVNPVISFLPPQACTGTTVSVYVDSSYYYGFNNYVWNNVAGNDTILITQDTIITVQVTDANGCIWLSDSVSFTFFQPAIPVIGGITDTLCSDDTLFLQINNPASFISYLWSNGTYNPSVSILPSSYGYITWWLQTVDTNNCVSYQQDSAWVMDCINATSSPATCSFAIGPNPADKFIHLFYSCSEPLYSLTLYSIELQPIMRWTSFPTSSHLLLLDLPDIPTGPYLLHVQSAHLSKIITLIKQ